MTRTICHYSAQPHVKSKLNIKDIKLLPRDMVKGEMKSNKIAKIRRKNGT